MWPKLWYLIEVINPDFCWHARQTPDCVRHRSLLYLYYWRISHRSDPKLNKAFKTKTKMRFPIFFVGDRLTYETWAHVYNIFAFVFFAQIFDQWKHFLYFVAFFQCDLRQVFYWLRWFFCNVFIVFSEADVFGFAKKRT